MAIHCRAVKNSLRGTATGVNNTSGKIATGINDTGSKFATSFACVVDTVAAGINDTGGKLPLVSTTRGANNGNNIGC